MSNYTNEIMDTQTHITEFGDILSPTEAELQELDFLYEEELNFDHANKWFD